jgi:hypothetical protein
MALLVIPTCFQAPKSTMQEEIHYDLLKPPYNKSGSTDIGYMLSVDSFLDRQQIEHLVCKVIQSEKPASYSTLAIQVYYKLDRWIPGGILFENEYHEKYIASYGWVKNLPDRHRRLFVVRDAQGNLYERPKIYEFDHEKDCK